MKVSSLLAAIAHRTREPRKHDWFVGDALIQGIDNNGDTFDFGIIEEPDVEAEAIVYWIRSGRQDWVAHEDPPVARIEHNALVELCKRYGELDGEDYLEVLELAEIF